MTGDLPLAGKSILVTRSKSQGKKMCEESAKLGCKPVHIPLIDFKRVNDEVGEGFIRTIGEYDWVMFTSANSVRFFFEASSSVGIGGFKHLKWAVVGSKTKKALMEKGFHPDFLPTAFTGQHFVEEFLKRHRPRHVLLPQGNLASKHIAAALEANNVKMDLWVLYETFLPLQSKKELIDFLTGHEHAIITFTSPSTVKNFMKIIKEYRLESRLSGHVFACIGPVTYDALTDHGVEAQICPSSYTVEDMLEGIVQYFQCTEEEENGRWN
ncbi:uroporphyrinogen-III synthase [Falsibacillus albus]|uniref:Uroporphyrinogen-III synthase n=1 Tax=Falsibacillus albus TaxID=2478915 RepID=A0A3L7K4Q0_9BACI|nr:uroporphyrinogen-III synthase [Falsibacillus albus]RLQ98033.1 uroporphyrinogen-III synthase [Falsibacillus albus]